MDEGKSGARGNAMWKRSFISLGKAIFPTHGRNYNTTNN
jgi:hypothetical protein